MKRGHLADHFEGVASKRLSAVEADPNRSNQHEFNGVQQLKQLFGEAEPVVFPARFIWFGEENEGVTAEASVTWYDARRAHPTRSEYRLYFPTTEVSKLAHEGDAILFCKRMDGSVLVVISEPKTTVYSQLHWLFGLEEQASFSFEVRELGKEAPIEVDFAARYILDELGIDPNEPNAEELDGLLEPFGRSFPPTLDFSAFARATLKGVSAFDDPDHALVAWMEREEILFKRLERAIVAEGIRQGFTDEGGEDVDGFLKFSLSVQNRRKSRAGFAMEHHLAEIFRAHKIRFDRGPITENRSRPDFLFPSAAEYHDPTYPADRLTMLASKASCKDRWRQALSEADRIQRKHLVTLEPGISESQTNEMRDRKLQLVVPSGIHATYLPKQAAWLMNLRSFIELARTRDRLG